MFNHPVSPAVLVIAIASSFLSGCEKSLPSSALPAQATTQKYQHATTLHGAVSDNKGFVEKGTVKVTSVSGELIASAELDNSKFYSVEVPANTPLPVLLKFSTESGEKLVAAVVHASITKYDISPLTTAIAKAAVSLGGYTDANMRQAAENSSSMSDPGKATAGAQGNPTQRYGGWH